MGTIGGRIKAARLTLGLSQEALAKSIGTTKSAISRYESGQREPSLRTLDALAEVLDVTVGYLEGYESLEMKKMIDALEAEDYRTLEKLIGIPKGSIKPLSKKEKKELQDSEAVAVETYGRDWDKVHQSTLKDKISDMVIDMYLDAITAADKATVNKFKNVPDDYLRKYLLEEFELLNRRGKIEAVLRINEISENDRFKHECTEDLTEIPRYRAEPAPQSTPASQKGTDTTLALDVPKGSQEPSEDK